MFQHPLRTNLAIASSWKVYFLSKAETLVFELRPAPKGRGFLVPKKKLNMIYPKKEKSLYSKLLGAGANLAVNKFLIKNVGLEAGFLFSILVDFESYLISKGELVGGDWFYAGREALEEQTTLSAHKQKQAEKILIEAGLIEVKLKGVPARNHYRICSELVLKIFENWMLKNLTTSSENSSDHYNNNTNNNTEKIIGQNFKDKNYSDVYQTQDEVDFIKLTIKELEQDPLYRIRRDTEFKYLTDDEIETEVLNCYRYYFEHYKASKPINFKIFEWLKNSKKTFKNNNKKETIKTKNNYDF